MRPAQPDDQPTTSTTSRSAADDPLNTATFALLPSGTSTVDPTGVAPRSARLPVPGRVAPAGHAITYPFAGPLPVRSSRTLRAVAGTPAVLGTVSVAVAPAAIVVVVSRRGGLTSVVEPVAGDAPAEVNQPSRSAVTAIVEYGDRLTDPLESSGTIVVTVREPPGP